MRKLGWALGAILLGTTLMGCGTSSRVGPRGMRTPPSVKKGNNLWFQRSNYSSDKEAIRESLQSESAFRGGGADMRLYPGAR